MPLPRSPVRRSRAEQPCRQARSSHADRRRQVGRPAGAQTGTLGNACIDIAKLPKETGCFTYDSGFTATASCKSAITYIDGDAGVLLYRGYPIEQLAKQSSFLEVAYLLMNGELPTARRSSPRSTTKSRITR